MGEGEYSLDEERRLWERILSTDTEVAFRDFVIDHLDPQPDESVLSVGCGPGFETTALAERIGDSGCVTGVDVNDAVLDAARECRSAGQQVSFLRGAITDLPVSDDSHDVVVAKQVLSAVSAVEAALTELYRVVEPGGRVAVTAGGGRTHVMHTPTDRLRRADEIYRSERGDRRLGTRLRGLLPEVGFTNVDVLPYAKAKTELDAQVERGIEVQRGFLEASDEFDDGDVEAWERDLEELIEMDQFLSCSTSFVYVGRKPE